MRVLVNIAFFFIASMVVYELFAGIWHFPFFSWFLFIPLIVALLLPLGSNTTNKCCDPKGKRTTAHAH